MHAAVDVNSCNRQIIGNRNWSSAALYTNIEYILDNITHGFDLKSVACSCLGLEPNLKSTPRQVTILERCVAYAGHLDAVPPRLQQQLSVPLQPQPRKPPFDCRPLTAPQPLRRWGWPPSARGRRVCEVRLGLWGRARQAARLDSDRRMSCGGEGGEAAGGSDAELRWRGGANGPDGRRPWKGRSCVTCEHICKFCICAI